MSKLSHFDKTGKVKMVDVSAKGVSAREARASAKVLVSAATVEAIQTGTNP